MLVLIPRNVKYKKIRKRVRIKKSKEIKVNILNNSVCGLKILESGEISMIVFEAIRRIIRRKTKKVGKLKINGFPSVPITKKPTGLRMGKGVGNIDSWIFPIKQGRILFELYDVPLNVGHLALKAAANKIGLRTKIISNNKFNGGGVTGNSIGS